MIKDTGNSYIKTGKKFPKNFPLEVSYKENEKEGAEKDVGSEE